MKTKLLPFIVMTLFTLMGWEKKERMITKSLLEKKSFIGQVARKIIYIR